MTHPLSITVLGAGSWGTALAILLAKNGQTVTLWDRSEERLNEMAKEGFNRKYLPDIPLPKSLQFCASLKDAIHHSNDILIAIPSHAMTNIISALKSELKSHHRIIWATKGLSETGEFFSDVFQREWGPRSYAVLSGPSFAKEVALGLPTAVTIASNHFPYAIELQNIFNNETFRVYTTQDLIGVQLGGVVKNIFGVAAGISDGLQLGANARAALITRGLAEMMRLGEALSAKRDTLMGLAGCGDVILTCTDNQSRNRRFGLLLSEGYAVDIALQKIGQVVEAVYNVEQLCCLAKERSVELPISEQVFRIMKQNVSPREAVAMLFSRTPKTE